MLKRRCFRLNDNQRRTMTTKPKTLFEKVWDVHVVTQDKGAPAVLYVNTHLIHEVPRRRPLRCYGARRQGAAAGPHLCDDGSRHSDAASGHNVMAQRCGDPSADPRENCEEFGVTLWDINGPVQGIVHVVGPEMGITQPGMTIVCGDSHTSTMARSVRGLWHRHQRGGARAGDAVSAAISPQDLCHHRGG